MTAGPRPSLDGLLSLGYDTDGVLLIRNTGCATVAHLGLTWLSPQTTDAWDPADGRSVGPPGVVRTKRHRLPDRAPRKYGARR